MSGKRLGSGWQIGFYWQYESVIFVLLKSTTDKMKQGLRNLNLTVVGMLSCRLMNWFEQFRHFHFKKFGDFVQLRYGGLTVISAPFGHGLLADMEVISKCFVLNPFEGQIGLYPVVYPLLVIHPRKNIKSLKILKC